MPYSVLVTGTALSEMFPSVCPSESALPRVFCMCRILLCNILISMFICPAEVLFLTSCLDCTDFKTIVQGDKAIINVLKEYTKNACFLVEVYNSWARAVRIYASGSCLVLTKHMPFHRSSDGLRAIPRC